MKECFFGKEGVYYRTNDFKPDRLTVVFIHGLSGSSSAWLRYEKRFEGDYNILSFDLRGHGKSLKPKTCGDYEISKFSNDLEELLAFLKIKKPVLISHSFGTLIAFELLRNNQDKFAASVFLSPVTNLRKRFLARLLEPLLLGTKMFALLPFSGKAGGHIDYSRYQNTGDWNIRRMIADVWNTTPRIYLYCTEQSYKFDGERFFNLIKIPVLIIHGKNDSISLVENSVEMAKEIKTAKLILLDNADHILVLNKFPEVSEAVADFLTNLKKPAL